MSQQVTCSVSFILGGAALSLLSLLCAGGPLADLQKSSRCGFHLAAVRETMDYIKEHSASGEIVFTDDWDVFGLFFYYNHHNRFIVGLDPKFTHERDPVLWHRYTRITQGKTPSSFHTELPDERGRPRIVTLTATLDDIRDHFHAAWVVVDDGHQALARQLEDREDLATLVYLSRHRTEASRPRYVVFRINEKGASTPEWPKPGE